MESYIMDIFCDILPVAVYAIGLFREKLFITRKILNAVHKLFS